MRVNDALMDDEVAEGYVLTCQAVPDTATVTVELRVIPAEYSSNRGGGPVPRLIAGHLDRDCRPTADPLPTTIDLRVRLKSLRQCAHRRGRNPQRTQPGLPPLRRIGRQFRRHQLEHLARGRATRSAMVAKPEIPASRGERPPERRRG